MTGRGPISCKEKVGRDQRGNNDQGPPETTLCLILMFLFHPRLGTVVEQEESVAGVRAPFVVSFPPRKALQRGNRMMELVPRQQMGLDAFL